MVEAESVAEEECTECTEENDGEDVSASITDTDVSLVDGSLSLPVRWMGAVVWCGRCSSFDVEPVE